MALVAPFALGGGSNLSGYGTRQQRITALERALAAMRPGISGRAPRSPLGGPGVGGGTGDPGGGVGLDGGSATGGPAGGATVTGFDPGLAALGLNTIGMFGPNTFSTLGTGLAVANSGIPALGIPGFGVPGNLTATTPTGQQVSVAAHNVSTTPQGLLGSLLGIPGLGAAPSFSVGIPGLSSGHVGEPSPDDVVSLNEAIAQGMVNSQSPAFGYTDPSNSVAGPNAPTTSGPGGATGGPSSGPATGPGGATGPGTGVSAGNNPGNTAGNEGSVSGGGGGGAGAGGDSVICTELRRQGYLDDVTWECDEAFGKILARKYPHVIAGYHRFGKPLAAAMRTRPWLTRLVWLIARPWAHEMKYRMFAAKRGSLIGKAIMGIGWLICARLGRGRVLAA